MRRRMTALVLVVSVAGLVLALIKPWASSDNPDGAATTLTDVTGIAELQRQFNRDQGQPRLILLLSPT